VHRATLRDGGARVVVKVQRPGVRDLVVRDLSIMLRLAMRAEQRTDWGRSANVAAIAREFGENVMRELDFDREARRWMYFREIEPVVRTGTRTGGAEPMTAGSGSGWTDERKEQQRRRMLDYYEAHPEARGTMRQKQLERYRRVRQSKPEGHKAEE